MAGVPKFIYFDLGDVLLNFSHEQACRQVSEVCGVPPEKLWKLFFEQGFQSRYEVGELTGEQFYEEFCRATDTRADAAALERAASDIFQLNESMLPVVIRLEDAGYRLGILSNTSESHWRHVSSGQWGIIPRAFDVLALSFQLKLLKPDPKIFQMAAELAGVAPHEIFYTDDKAGYAAAAREVGFDAVQYTSTPELVAELRRRGVKFNY